MQSRKMSRQSGVDLDEVDDSVVPAYLRPSIIYRAWAKEVRSRELDALIQKTRAKEETVKPPRKWQVREIDLNAWRKNIHDERSIYRELASPESCRADSATEKVRPPTLPELTLGSRTNSDLLLERNYIKKRTFNSQDFLAQRLLATATTQFNTPALTALEPDSYGAPADEFRCKALLKKKPKLHTVDCKRVPADVFTATSRRMEKGYCRRKTPTQCEYCDVLGPSSCEKCLEILNRRLAEEAQSTEFPAVQSTLTNIVAPKLVKLMTRGDKLARKQRHRDRNKKKVTFQRNVPNLEVNGRSQLPALEPR